MGKMTKLTIFFQVGDGFPLIGKSQRQTSGPPPPSLWNWQERIQTLSLSGMEVSRVKMAKGMMTDADWKDDERWNKNRSETYQILVKTASKTSTSLRDFLCCGCKN